MTRAAATLAALALAATAVAACSPATDGTQRGDGSRGADASPTAPEPGPGGDGRDPRVVRVVALGDFGSGTDGQYDVARAMCRHREREPYSDVVTTGDNIYETGAPEDFELKFFTPYRCLLQRGVEFHATLGNHDVATDGGRPELAEPAFGMPARHYTWRAGPITFVALDSNGWVDDGVDEAQTAWLVRRLRAARDRPWTVVAMHHPIYSGGAYHGPTPSFAATFDERFARLGVDLVLQGHDHIYSRARSNGVTYVVTGGGGAALTGCADPPRPRVARCESKLHFVELEATRRTLVTSAIGEGGATFDRYDVPRNRDGSLDP
ncbi:MAG TPA: metallophosphoesterase [Actinomycetota bacterium]|nr:metallophosphoesterase [Actinomycetota bacterium]